MYDFLLELLGIKLDENNGFARANQEEIFWGMISYLKQYPDRKKVYSLKLKLIMNELELERAEKG